MSPQLGSGKSHPAIHTQSVTQEFSGARLL